MKTPRLSNSDIEYLDKGWNFTSGCLKGCSYCYARPITKRFSNHYPNGFEPTLYPEALLSPLYLKKPSRIGVCFMGDLFTNCPEFDPDRNIHATMPSGKASVSMSLKGWIFTTIEQCPQHTFVFLTKQPQNLIKFSPFPDQCWVGISVTGTEYPGYSYLAPIEAKVKYISCEPLLSPVHFTPDRLNKNGIKWVIIGAQTKPYKPPKIEWVQEIVEACDKAGVKVFLKNSLKSLLLEDAKHNIYSYPEWAGKQFAVTTDGRSPMRLLRQEMPTGA